MLWYIAAGSAVGGVSRYLLGGFIQRLSAAIGHVRIALVRVLRDGLGDSIVETSVERSKFVYLNRRVALECQVRDGLAQIAVVMNHLIYRKALLQELAPV